MKHIITLFCFFPGLLIAQMNGTYTVGGSAPDFTSIGEACDSIVSQGINGSVVINIRDGVYVNDSIHLNNLVGASAMNTITFQSESLDSAAVTINHSNAEVVFLKDSTCGYITIQHLTLVQNGSRQVIRLRNGPHHCDFNTLNLYRSANGSMFYYSNSIVNPSASDIELVNSHFGSAPGLSSLNCIEMYANNGVIDTVLIANNIFDFPLSTGGSGFAEFTDVSNIEFKDNFVRGVFSTGIYPQFASGQNKISGNEMYIYDSGVFALDLADCDGDFSITNNIVRTGNGTYTYGTYGMSIYTMSGRIEVYNNTFYVDERGLDVYASDSVLSYNNLIYVNLQGSTTNPNGVYVVQNSNFYSDYNAFYSNTNFAQVSGTSYADLASYFSATGNDANSFILVDPEFYDDSLDLHVCNDSLIGAGDPLLVLNVDVDGEIRNSSSIGADYFEPLEAGFSYTQNGYDVQFTNTSVWANDITWDFGDGNSSNEASPLHTYASNGTYTVMLTATNNCGSVDSTIQLSLSVGLDDLTKDQLTVYPNPSHGSFVVQINEETGPIDVTIISLNGEVIYHKEMKSGTTIDLNAMNGVYLMEVTTSREVIRRNLIIQ